MSIEPASTLSCVVCGVSGDIKLKRCAKCKSAVYCSRDHQVQDWPSHKKVCGKSADLPEHRVPVKVNIHKTDVSMTPLKNEHEKTLSEGLNAEKEKNSTHQEPSGTVFDKRPFKRKCFVQPKSFTIDTVAEFVVENLLTNNYCVVDGLFDKGHLIETIWEIQSLDTSLKPGMLAGGKTSGDNKKKVVDVEIRNDKIMWLDCNGLCHNREVSNIEKVVSKMDEITSACNKFLEVTGQCLINGRTKAMVACYPGNGSFYKRHVDNPSKDGRKITCILYLNPEWDVTKNGGLLRIFSQDYSDYVDIPPLLNRMLFFWSDGRNPHEVQPAFKNRYAITVWYFDEIERKLAKEAAIKSDIAKIAGEIALVDVRYKEKEKLLLEERIDIEARKAIKSLSEEELMAIGSMIKGQQNQKAILEQLGINDNIQKYLLQTLKERGFV